MNTTYNSFQGDIRLSKITLENAEKILKSFEGVWVYVKSITRVSEEFVTQYYKFQVRQIDIDLDCIRIYGDEDEDRLIINKNEIVQTESSSECDEIKLLLSSKNLSCEMFLKKYLLRIDNRIQDIMDSKRNLIITEGKTDWKHLKRALILLKEDGRFTELDIDFFEYEDFNMGNKTLEKVCEYNALFNSNYLKIFVYDSDNPEINKKHANMSFFSYGNNVYSVVLPVPEHRKETPLISIEHYYSNDEIKTCDIHGRRLFLAEEFDLSTGIHYANKNVCALNINSKVASNLIVDDKVYQLDAAVRSKEDVVASTDKVNIALTKKDFANNVFRNNLPFNEFSVEAFKSFYYIIDEIFRNPQTIKDGIQEEISKGVYLNQLTDGFQEIFLHCSTDKDTAMEIKASTSLATSFQISCCKKEIVLSVSNKAFTSGIDVPIDLSNKLVDFLVAKTKNKFNRIYLFVYDEQGDLISQKEIFKTDEANILITRVLNQLVCNELDNNVFDLGEE